MDRILRRPLVIALLAVGCTAHAQTPSSPPPAPPDPCAAPESRQFDFWIGEWDVYLPNGKLAGRNRIQAIYGCVLHESWKAGRMEGQSFNRFDPARGVWHQTWVDSTGTILLIEGGLRDGAMVMTDANVPGRKPDAAVNEIRWSKNDDGSVRQWWRVTTDGGKTWTTAFDGKYVRAGGAKPQ